VEFTATKKVGMEQVARTAETAATSAVRQIILPWPPRREKQNALAERLFRELSEQYPDNALFASNMPKQRAFLSPRPWFADFSLEITDRAHIDVRPKYSSAYGSTKPIRAETHDSKCHSGSGCSANARVNPLAKALKRLTPPFVLVNSRTPFCSRILPVQSALPSGPSSSIGKPVAPLSPRPREVCAQLRHVARWSTPKEKE